MFLDGKALNRIASKGILMGMSIDPSLGELAHYERFNSIRDFTTTIQQRNVSEYYDGECSSSKGGSESSLLHSLEEAYTLIHHGWIDKVREVERIHKRALDIHTLDVVKSPLFTSSVEGFAPHVPNAIQGLPNSMIRVQQKPLTARAISIYFETVHPHYVDPNVFVAAGVGIARAVNLLDLTGTRVKLHAYAPNYDRWSEELYVLSLTLKDYQERFSLRKCLFPLAHPGFLRRLIFRWIETIPNLTHRLDGYGASYSYHLVDDVKAETYLKQLNTMAPNGVYISSKSLPESEDPEVHFHHIVELINAKGVLK